MFFIHRCFFSEFLGGIISAVTRLLEKAIEHLRSLPESKQDELALFLLSELDEDSRWSQTTSKYEHELKGLVDQVLSDDDRA
jgi:hypothetical protein